ncbi:related to lustrin A [Cephalotrichum gorgonifer]|uniref:Related to lustrin A n=1 Tax=Cephalotrichum gorgonifer TaxID=2041049 RepID=A0AAE8N6I0_9PEZI|nr:related to lustrin A [Cephalotrichum gorgonifer]
MESTSAPLADYFWVAGLESVSYNDTPLPTPTLPVDTTIVEDELECIDPLNGSSRATARHSRQSSNHRISKLSNEARFSINTLDEVDGNTRSNRSSATIKPINNNGPPTSTSTLLPGPNEKSPLSDFDFDNALFKFAAEREHFLEDLSFTAGAKTQSRPPMVNPRAERIKADETDTSGRRSPMRSIKGSIRGSIKGSIRRKMSFRDMNSSRKQPSAAKPGLSGLTRTTTAVGSPISTMIPERPEPRQHTDRLAPLASIRTAKRLSNYNSVIPPPEPLNTDPDMHPLKRRFEPVLLDRYPPANAAVEVARRGRFPDYVPMFAFPNDIQIVSSDDRPRSTWHGFTMTSDDNGKIYGICVIVWTALDSDVAEDIEKRCEAWRQSHMSNEERELAASLGVRLAGERTNLSQLLARLPQIPSGSHERDTLEDQISAVEEKISLMTEMLRPLRHGAASKIDGLTTGETGLWAPRAYGVMGRDASRMPFWKEWLRGVIVPMTDGAVLRVPPSSPKVGRWQPLERYVVNLCVEAFNPLGSKTQVEIGVRELRLYARQEAANEIPGSRSTDIYALFRCLSLENIVALFEYAMAESRIIFLSSHTGMLHLACHALASLLYPFKWASVFIPVLPSRLLSALEAPCPYIVGIERRYDNIELPEDDYVLVDLDKDTIDATSQPIRLPRQQRRKLLALLQVAAPAKLRYGVTTGPPPYAVETFPYDAFSAEDQSIFSPTPPEGTLGKWASQSSAAFSEEESGVKYKPPLFNVFSLVRPDNGKSDRPGTSKSARTSPPSSVSPMSMSFPPMPSTPISRSDSGFAATLREKRSGHFDEKTRRSSSFGVERHAPMHRPSLPFLNGHAASTSISSISVDSVSSYGVGGGGYAPSTYAQSTLAASTIMPNMMVQPVRNTETTAWVEGHCFDWCEDTAASCTICNERAEMEGIYKCAGCGAYSHGRCLGFVCIVCPPAFHEDRVRVAFIRCIASLTYTYRKYLGRPSKIQRNNGQLYAFDMAGFVKSLPHEQQEYAMTMRETQTFNEFIHEREMQPASHPSIRLFDEILLAKKARGRPNISSGFSRLSVIRASHGASMLGPGHSGPPSRANKLSSYLTDKTDHIWRTASVPVPNSKFPGDYRAIVSRMPTKLDPSLMREPRSIQGVPRPEQRKRGVARKQVPSMVGPVPPQ